MTEDMNMSIYQSTGKGYELNADIQLLFVTQGQILHMINHVKSLMETHFIELDKIKK